MISSYSDYQREINKLRKQELILQNLLEIIQKSCLHNQTDKIEFYPDASGNNDSSYKCLMCGLESKCHPTKVVKTLKKHTGPWNEDVVFYLNSLQHDAKIHPFTCGKDSNHRPLIATVNGWKCADCEYTQDWY